MFIRTAVPAGASPRKLIADGERRAEEKKKGKKKGGKKKKRRSVASTATGVVGGVPVVCGVIPAIPAAIVGSIRR